MPTIHARFRRPWKTASFPNVLSLRATNLAQTIWNERLTAEASISSVTTTATCANSAGPSSRAIETLKPKLMPATSTEPTSITMLPLSTRDAAPRSRQTFKRNRHPVRSGSEIVSEPEFICCLRAAALDVENRQQGFCGDCWSLGGCRCRLLLASSVPFAVANGSGLHRVTANGTEMNLLSRQPLRSHRLLEHRNRTHRVG